MQEKAAMHCIVSGKVQGVWFRVATQDQAKNLGLTGWVRNLPEGQVEVLAFGAEDKLARLYEWLKQGPELAEVVDVMREEVPWEVHGRFAVK